MRRVYPPAEYRRVAHLLWEHIEAGLYRPGEKLPTVTELAELHGIKQGAAFASLRLLTDEGLVIARRGCGYYVKGKK